MTDALGERPKAPILLCLALLAACAAALLAPPSKAHATEVKFCWNATINPHAKCWGPSTLNLKLGVVRTHERAGCVGIATGENVLVSEWACGPAGSWPGYAALVSIGVLGYETRHKAILLNGNQHHTGVFAGDYECWTSAC